MKTINQSLMPKTARINENNHLEIGGCDTVDLVQQYGTPLYVLDEESVRTACREYHDAFKEYEKVRFLYASKAFASMALCPLFHDEHFGLEVVSGGEIHLAKTACFPMNMISFNGNNKTPEELEMALEAPVGRIVVDNFDELEALGYSARKWHARVNVLLRVTPGIECHTHEYIRTGQIDSKFGFDLDQLMEAVDLAETEHRNLTIRGLHAHIGSQIFETEVFKDEVGILLEQFAKIKRKYKHTLTELNLGGGLGIKYTDGENPPSRYDMARVVIQAVRDNCSRLGIRYPELILEPGRSVTGTAGVTLYTTGTHKTVPGVRKYVAVDGGMADNPRPAMYQAEYQAILANRANEKPEETVTIAGRFCESGDILIKNIELPVIEKGDVLCVFNTGAYNYSMSSNYNYVPRPPVVLVNNGLHTAIIKRETYEDLERLHSIPQRFNSLCHR